jgi:hypothetical protein
MPNVSNRSNSKYMTKVFALMQMRQMALDAAPCRGKICSMKKLVVMAAGLMVLFISGATLRAQAPVPPPGPAGPALAPDQLDQLVGPIALYPDPLIAEILPAATFPTEIVLASRYVSQGGDPNQVENQGWDPSIQALTHYANVLKWMDDNLTWTTQLGQAFQFQQADVMNAVQRLRAKAQALGNLPSTPQESVVADDGDIEIEPTDPDQIYVPDYQPDAIYFQPGIFCTFPYWLPVGGWLVNDWNWRDHGLISWGPGHPRPVGWWRESPVQRHSFFAGHPMPVWHAGAAVAVGARGGWQRGFATPAGYASFTRPTVAPREAAPRIINVRSAPITRQPVAVRAEAPREEIRSAPSAGFFGGGQSGREAVESSSRGEASRASIGGGGGARGGHR